MVASAVDFLQRKRSYGVEIPKTATVDKLNKSENKWSKTMWTSTFARSISYQVEVVLYYIVLVGQYLEVDMIYYIARWKSAFTWVKVYVSQ